MILSVCEVHIHIQVLLDLFHHTAKLSIAVYFSYHKSDWIVEPENLIECTIVLDVLLGVHWDQASGLDCSINCGQHTAFINVHVVHAQINIVGLRDYFLWDLNEITSHWFGLAPR
jgi:hypothetical protein